MVIGKVRAVSSTTEKSKDWEDTNSVDCATLIVEDLAESGYLTARQSTSILKATGNRIAELEKAKGEGQLV